jgi:hypothetical protein
VPVTLNAADTGGSGVASIEYKLDADPTYTNYTGTFDVSGQGYHNLAYRAADVAGNNNFGGAAIIKIDNTFPTTTVSKTPSGEWANTDVTVTLEGHDSGGSTLDYTEYSLNGSDWTHGTSVTVSAEGETTVYYRSADVAGNVETAGSVTVKVDKSAPATTITAGPSGWTTASPTFVWGGSDNKTPVEELVYSYQLDSGAWSDYSAATSQAFSGLSPGSHTFSVRAKDLAGNVDPSPDTRTFSVDNLAPTTTASKSPSADWAMTDVTVTLTGHDTGGSAVDKTYWKIDSGEVQTYDPANKPVLTTTGQTLTY